MKEYADLLGTTTPTCEAFTGLVRDVTEFLAAIDLVPLSRAVRGG